MFWHWQGTPAPALAALSLFYATASWSYGGQLVAWSLQGYGPTGKRRPLAVDEHSVLVGRFACLPERSRRILSLAMRRLLDSNEN